MLLVLTLSGCATAFAPTRLVTPDELRDLCTVQFLVRARPV